MNAHQTPKPTHSESRRLPNVQIRQGDLVVIRQPDVWGAGIAETVGQMAGGKWGTVISAHHVAHGILAVTVKHDNAAHPTGLEQFRVLATGRTIVQSAL